MLKDIQFAARSLLKRPGFTLIVVLTLALRLFISQGMRLVLLGLLIGLGGALALTRLMSSLLFGVSTTDTVTFVVVGLMLMLVGVLACYLPARRATRVDPLIALRYE